jgi:hypothetical protein
MKLWCKHDRSLCKWQSLVRQLVYWKCSIAFGRERIRAGDELMSWIYSMLMSVDGCVEDEHGRFGSAAPDEEEHSYIL